jgi:hypothetical protein
MYNRISAAAHVYLIEYLQQHTYVEQNICSNTRMYNRISAAAHVYRIEYLQQHTYAERKSAAARVNMTEYI